MKSPKSHENPMKTSPFCRSAAAAGSQGASHGAPEGHVAAGGNGDVLDINGILIRIFMGFSWDFHGILGFSWDFHGIFMGFWAFHGILRRFSWDFHEIFIGIFTGFWVFHGILRGF